MSDHLDDPTVRRVVLNLDPGKELPTPAPLAPPVFDEIADPPAETPEPAPEAPAASAAPAAPAPSRVLAAPLLEDEDDAPAPAPAPVSHPVVAPVPEVLDEPATAPAPAPAREPEPVRAPRATLTERFNLPVVQLAVLGALAVGLLGAVAGITLVPALVVLLLAAAAGLWVLAHQPVLVLCAMGFVLGAAPGVQTPGIGVSLTFVLAGGSWIALAVMPQLQHRVNWAAGLSAVLIGLAFFTLVGNPVTGAAVSDFVRWAVTASAVYPLSILAPSQLARVGRWFVYGTTLAAAFGIALVVVDRDGSLLDRLQIFGYGAAGTNGRYVFGANGNFSRLTSTYVDPNLGGFLMAVGLALAIALLRGRLRTLSVGLLGVAVILTLSRADIGSVVVAAGLLMLFSGIAGRLRGRLLALGVAGSLAALAVPAVRSRLTNSFGANDRGSSARWEAFEIFPDQMSGHWLLGRGFGAPELTDAAAAAATNYVANAPLLTVYRGGIVVGLAFTALMLTAALFGWRLMRSSSWEHAAVGAGYLGLMLIALQLDFPVVTLSPATLAFALLLAFVSRPDALQPPPVREPTPAETEAETAPEAAPEEELIHG